MRFTARSLLSLARSAVRLLGSPPQEAPPRTTSRKGAGARRSGGSAGPRPAPPRAGSRTAGAGPGAGAGAAETTRYPGDYEGAVRPVYSPHPDGVPDPGEVVWTWVPYEEDPTQGKDRPVLLIGRSGDYLLALMMTTRDRSNAGRTDPDYVDVGSGAWDRQGRPSEVKVDRVLRIRPADIRRDGAVLEEAMFSRVADALARRRR